jgi:hypothetical protein
MCKGESKIARSDVLLIIELSYNRKTLEPGAVNAFHPLKEGIAGESRGDRG